MSPLQRWEIIFTTLILLQPPPPASGVSYYHTLNKCGTYLTVDSSSTSVSWIQQFSSQCSGTYTLNEDWSPYFTYNLGDNPFCHGYCGCGPAYQGGNIDSCVTITGSFNTLTVRTNLCTTQCAAGYMAFTGCTQCQQCDPGTFQSLPGQTFCSACQPGSYSESAGSIVCPFCAVGQFAAVSGLTVCSNCNPGKYASNGAGISAWFGAVQCSACAAGKFSGEKQSVCSQCAAGTYSLSSASQCTQCEPGKYSSAPASSTCTACASGQAASGTGSTVCSQCLPGYSAASSGAVKCQACASGTYSDQLGATFCKECSAGSYSVQDNTTALSACLQCSAGSYSASARATSCLTCPAGTYSASTGATSCSPCAAGKYSSTPGSTVCTTCTACPTSGTGFNETSKCTSVQDTVCTRCDSIYPMDWLLELAYYTQSCDWKCAKGHTKVDGRCVPCYPHPAEGFIFEDECRAGCDVYFNEATGLPAPQTPSSICDPLSSQSSTCQTECTPPQTGCNVRFYMPFEKCLVPGYYLDP